MPNKRAQIFYQGNVQGVGFRYTAERTAIALGLTGWVKNLRDGRVEVLCEGSEHSINTFLEKIASIFKVYITDAGIKWSEPTGEYNGFEIEID